MEQNKKQEKAISHTGCHLFDGTLSFKMGGKEYKVRCEYHGLDLQRASQEHQIVMLIKQHLPYDEIDTGWLVRTKNLDKEHRFGPCCIPEGVLLGQMEDNIYVAHTFITYDMCGEIQKESFEKSRSKIVTGKDYYKIAKPTYFD